MTRWRPAYQKGAVVAPTSAMGWLARGVICLSAFLRWDDGGHPILTPDFAHGEHGSTRTDRLPARLHRHKVAVRAMPLLEGEHRDFSGQILKYLGRCRNRTARGA